MPNEDTSLLKVLNSFITCPVCKVSNGTEIIITCGHLICTICKTKRTKCPICYSDLAVTKRNSPSIKFIKELRKEISNASTGDIISASEINVGNSSNVSNVKGEQTTKGTRKDSGLIDYEKIKEKTNFGSREELENDDVKKINELNIRNKDSNRKNSSQKKEIIFYRNYCKHKEERKIYKTILSSLGIVGIDKQINKIKSKHALNASEKERNLQLNNIISRLNDQHSDNEDLENSKFNYSFKMVTDSDSSDSEQDIKINYKTSMNCGREAKDHFDAIKCGSKIADVDLEHQNCSIMKDKTKNDCKILHDENGFSVVKTTGGLKRKKTGSGADEGPCSKTFVKSIDPVDNCIEFGTINLVNLDKKLGGIVDETEIVQRYSNASMNDTGKEEITDIVEQCNNFAVTHDNELQNKPEVCSEEPAITNKTTIDDKKCERLSKSEINNIISDLMAKINPNSEEDGLQSDIMADMLHNVANEIVVVGNTLCEAKENAGNCNLHNVANEIVVGNTLCEAKENAGNGNNLINGSQGVSDLKIPPVNNSPCESSETIEQPLTIKNETESNFVDSDIIVISDSEDDIKVVEEYSISDFSHTKTDETDIHGDQDVNIKNCKIVIENVKPLMFQSISDNNKHMGNDECLRHSNVEKSLSMDSTINLYLKNKRHKKEKLEGQKRISKNNKLNLMQALPKVPVGQKTARCEEVLNDFEGFTDQEIMIPTVNLALFKMNGCKYSKNFSSSSLYFLDGKQILIKEVSQEESYPESPYCSNKISDLTIEISDSEDESSKSLVSSGVQTENEFLTVTPSPSTSKVRPVSLPKLRGFEIENEKFMQSDVLDTKKPFTPKTPLGQESFASSLSQSSPALRTTPVSRRQLSFVSPSFDNTLQYLDDGASTSNTKTVKSISNSSLNDDWQVLHYRMQHMIPSNPEEKFHSEYEHSEISPTRLTFTTCALNSKETALVTKLAQMTKSCLTKDFTHNTTHLVIGASGRGRLEYYLAIAYRAFIVTMDWVNLCLALNKILPVTGFIPTEDEGPLKCLEPISLPFVGFHVSSKIVTTSSNYPIAEITKTLLSLGGARVLSDLDAFHSLQDGHYPRFFVYNSKSVLTQAVVDKCASLHILPIQFMWVYESIGAFRALPVMDFLDIGVHSRTLIRDYKIPDQLACSRYPRLEGEFHPQILDERYQRSL